MATTKYTEGDDAAFPTQNQYHYFHGMTLRDWFAGQALSGMLSSCDTMIAISRTAEGYAKQPAQSAATIAYEFADAMLAAREPKA